MEILFTVLLIIILLFLKGFFSGSEIALVNSDKMKLQHKARQGHKGAQLVLKLFQAPDILLGTTLVGTNIATVALTTIAATMFIQLFGSMGDFLFLNIRFIEVNSVFCHYYLLNSNRNY